MSDIKQVIWKQIPDYLNYYISNTGLVKNTKFKQERILKSNDNGKGYHFVQLYNNGKAKQFYIHRLIASVFLSKLNEDQVVNHKDGDKSNNHIENLEWCSIQENNQHAFDIGLKTIWNKGKSGKDTSRSKTVYQYDLHGVFIDEYGSTRDAGKFTGVSYSGISAVCRGERNQAGGFIWSYTTLAIGPDYSDKIDKITGRLKLR